MNLEYEILFEEERRNVGGGRDSIYRVTVKKQGVKKPYRNETFTDRSKAVDRFNQFRRILNVSVEPLTTWAPWQAVSTPLESARVP